MVRVRGRLLAQCQLIATRELVLNRGGLMCEDAEYMCYQQSLTIEALHNDSTKLCRAGSGGPRQSTLCRRGTGELRFKIGR
jgi:hypothetical protein